MVTLQDLEDRIIEIKASIDKAISTQAVATEQQLRKELAIASLAMEALRAGIYDG